MRTNYVLIDYESVQPEDVSPLKQDHFRVIVFVGARQTKIPFETAVALQQMGSNAEYVKISGTGPNALDFHIAFYIGIFAEKDPEAYFYIVSKDSGFDPLLHHLKSRKRHAFRVKTVLDIPVLKVGNLRSTANRIAVIVDDLHERGAAKPRKLGALNIKTARDIPLLKAGNAKSTANRIAVIVDDPKRGAAKPRKLGALDVKTARDIPLLKAGKAKSKAERIAVIVDSLHRRGAAKPRTMKTLTSTIGSLFPKLSPDEISALLAALEVRGYVAVFGSRVAYKLPT